MAFASINQASVSGGSSNALSIQSDGIFMPRLSTGQRTALALTTSDAGLTVYDFTLNNLFIWNGTAWESIPGSGDAGANGSVQYNDNGIVSGATNFTYNNATSAVSVAGDLTVRTTGLTVNSSGVGVGTSSQSSFLGNSPKKLVIGDGTQTPALTLYGGSTTYGGIYFADGTIGNEAYRGFIEYDHVVDGFNFGIVGSSSLTINSAANLVLRGGTAGANGVGVTFPATQVASSDANCLDDYEEGTWTGTIGGTTTNPTTPLTSTGRYTKIGRQVSVEIGFYGDTTGASGRITVSALPFTSNASLSRPGIIALDTMGTFTGSPVAYLAAGVTSVDLYASSSNGSLSNVTHNAGGGRALYMELTYTV
jgi:hypothetical protein